MRIISEKYYGSDQSKSLSSAIIEYDGRLFRIADYSPTKLFVWSGLNGWLYIDNGDRKETTKEHIEQFLPVMRAFSNEKENF